MTKILFKEIDVTNNSKAHLIMMMRTIYGGGWKKYIEDLEMIVIDERIIIRGWGTKKVWEKFIKNVIENSSLDYVYMV